MKPTEQSGQNSSRQRRRILWPFLLAAVIVVASSQGEVATPVRFDGMDKVVHCLVYGALATLVLRVPWVARHPWRVFLTIAAASLFGASDECHQSFTPGRQADVFDWLADTLGACLAVALYVGSSHYRNLLEWPLRRRRGSDGTDGTS
jgi:VanZ family protein